MTDWAILGLCVLVVVLAIASTGPSRGCLVVRTPQPVTLELIQQ